MTSRIALITGASSGIGKATAECLARDNFSLILCGRREEILAEMEKELSAHTKVIVRTFDVRNRDEVEENLKSLPPAWEDIEILVNNAGNAHGLDLIQDGDVDDWDAMLDINVKGLLYVSRAILPGMVRRRKGHIVNLGSIAGREVYPMGAVYCASKAAVDAITEGMRIDLIEYGIRVSVVSPGLVETGFSAVRFKGDKKKATEVYKGMQPLTGGDIAEIIQFIVTRPSHVVLADVLVMPTAQAGATLVNRTR